MIEIIYVVILCLLFALTGIQILRWAGFKSEGFLEDICIGFALGALLISLLIYLLSFFKLLYAAFIYAILILFFIISIMQFPFFAKGFKKTCLSIKLQSKGFLFFLLLFAVGSSLLLNLVGALSPTTGIDDTSYHFAMPKLSLKNHGFVYVPMVSLNNPMTIEMLYTLAIAIKNDILAKLLHYSFGIATAFALYLVGRRFWNKKVGAFSALIFLSIPMIGMLQGMGYIELGFIFFFLISVYAFLRWHINGQLRWIVLSAFLAGGAASTKSNAPIVVVLLFLYGIFYGYKKYGIKAFSYGIILLVVASSFTGLWFLKNFLLTGNPIIPFGGNLFPTSDWGAENTKEYIAHVESIYVRPGIYDKSLPNLLVTPFNLTIGGWRKYEGIAFLGPLLLGFLPLAFFVRKKGKQYRFLIFMLLSYYSVWFFTYQRVRYLMPAFTLLCLLGGVSLEYSRIAPSKKVVSWIFVVIILLNMPVLIDYHAKDHLPVVLGLESKEDYLSRKILVYEAFSWINENLSDKDKVFLIDTVRGYYVDIPYLWGDEYIQGVIDFSSDYEQVLRQVKKLKITHVLLIKEETGLHPNARRWAEQAILNKDLTQVFETDAAKILQVK